MKTFSRPPFGGSARSIRRSLEWLWLQAAQGQDLETITWGVHELKKGNEAFTQGALVYFDGDKASAAGGVLLGAAGLPASADAPVVRVKLNGISIETGG